MLSCIIAPLGVLIFIVKGNFMETRVAVLAIIVENTESVEELNKTLHEYGNFIIGRDFHIEKREFILFLLQ